MYAYFASTGRARQGQFAMTGIPNNRIITTLQLRDLTSDCEPRTINRNLKKANVPSVRLNGPDRMYCVDHIVAAISAGLRVDDSEDEYDETDQGEGYTP